jgi:hypothetical protein
MNTKSPREFDLMLSAALRREEELAVAVETERERVKFLLDAIASYLYELRNYPESAASKSIELSLASHRVGSMAFGRRGLALYDLFKALDRMGPDMLSLEVLAALQTARHL